jgi:pimeloyl-ACP methyl ester carboxylesterase
VPLIPEFYLGSNHAQAVGDLIYRSAIQKEAFPPDVLMRYRDAISKPLALQSSLAYYRTFFYNIFKAREGEPANASILVPTLLIWGEQDVALDIALTQGLEQWVTDLRIKRIFDSGHWAQEEKAMLVNSYLKEFLQT